VPSKICWYEFPMQIHSRGWSLFVLLCSRLEGWWGTNRSGQDIFVLSCLPFFPIPIAEAHLQLFFSHSTVTGQPWMSYRYR
jgi:hypothetical protein